MRTACALLLALALPMLTAADWFTTEEINGLANLCNVSSANPDPHALSVVDCRNCVFGLTGPSSTIEKSGRAYACQAVCQDNNVINKYVASNGAVTTFTPTVAGQRANLCTACLNRATVTPFGCQLCLQTNSAISDVTTCMDCLEQNPFANNPAKAYLTNSYQWACGQCQSIPINEPTNPGAARAQCKACIASPTAQRIWPGILSAFEFASTTTDPTPTARDNDFGRCVYFSNQTYLINTGSAEIKGVFESCKTGLQTSTKLQCAQCMFAAQKSAISNPDSTTTLPYKLQIATPKDWACASYCQDPSYQPASVTLATSQSAKCEACVQSPGVKDAWACGNCLKLSKVTGASVDTCFTNVQDDPYAGYASNYNWAVGMCSTISIPALRDLCITCIRSQPLPQPNAAGVIQNAAFNTTTEANICSCVDLTLNNTAYTSRVLDPMEKQCFAPHKYIDSNGTEQTPAIPWGVGFPLTVDSGCLDCMAQAVAVAPRNLNKKYACTQYCQDPALVKSQDQGQQCAVCVVNPLVSNPWGCQNCMVVTSDEASRRRCFQCVQAPNGQFDSHAWGCGQCAQFTNLTAQSNCFRCLTVGLDPCVCVDLTKNGTVLDALPPQGAACSPRTFRVWYWAKGLISKLSFGITSLPWPYGTEFYSKVDFAVNAANSRLVPGAGDGDINVYSLDLDVSSVPVTTWAAITGTKAFLNLAYAVPGPAGGGVFWDASQSTVNSENSIWSATSPLNVRSFFAIPQLALQVIDACGGIVYDSVTNFGFDKGGYTIKQDPVAGPVAARLFTLLPVAPGTPYPLGPIPTPQQLQLYPSLDGPVVTVTFTGPDTNTYPDLGYPAIFRTPGVGQVTFNIAPSLDVRILTATTVGQPSYWDTTLSVFEAGKPIGTPYIAANDDIFGSTSFDPVQCGGTYPGTAFRVGGQWCQLSTVTWAAPAGKGYVLVLSGYLNIPQNHGPYAVKISSLPLAVNATVGELHISTANTTVG